MAEGFLGRWSQRKQEVKAGKPVEADPPADGTPAAGLGLPDATPALTEPEGGLAPAATQDAPPPLTLLDAQALTPQSDFKPFMAGDVGPEVRNAAMKKLFADPHFNVMDGLDIYIDDYSKSDPIPESMLRQMTSAKFLKLFEDKDDEEGKQQPGTEAVPRENANNPTDESVAQSSYAGADISTPLPDSSHSSQPEPLPGSGASQEDHAHTDLRLQPDHAAPAPDAGRSTQ